jgi:hypothetical protein
LLSRRVGLPLLAAALLLIGTLVAAPSVSGAPPARVKQFTASLSGGAAPGSFTMTVTNCGGTPLVAPCTRSSTIDLGAVQIVVPSDLQPATFVSARTPSGTTWTGSYNTVTNTIDVIAPGGSNKLRPGQSLLITFNVATTPTCEGTNEFTTSAWGANAIAGSDSFELLGSQPTLNCLPRGGSVTDPVTGQTETITGDFTGHVIITFGGNTADCSFDTRLTAAAGDGDTTYGAQWAQYHLPAHVAITPAGDFVAGSNPKISTSEFDQTFFGGDSSWYLICYAVPIDEAHPTAFHTIGGGTATDRTIDGVHYWVGILEFCDLLPEPHEPPCVSEQFLTTGPGSPPWNPADNRIHIAIEIPPNDPYKR